ncbi:MAG: gamma-glutamyltransferase [Ignavibacteriales bacterium]|nr:gamma-glutamyltransferase [Ignavibacteriaceae bacterium]NLH60950.1 gamma-glutamyltransferase [Ignavibacteriales bacterium]
MLRRKSSYFSLLFLVIFCGSLLANSHPVQGKNGMVVTAQELATKVGLHILKKGGNAIDAAVAVGFALAVTYPAAGNLGGGGYMVIRKSDGTCTTLDYRERAPMKAFRDMYLDAMGNHQPILSEEGVTSSGVPGSVAGLIYALEKYGTMKLSEVIQPAINLATDGFSLSNSDARIINSNFKNWQKYESSGKIFLNNGEKYQEGEIFKQKDLGKTLGLIKKFGKDGFYKGETAKLIVEQMTKDGGYMTLEDLENYKVIEREPLRGTYKGYEIVSMPPSSSGGTALIQMLNILENTDLAKLGWGSSEYYHYLVETMRRVYADRSKHLGDPEYYDVPLKQLISKEYARERFSSIKEVSSRSSEVLPGEVSGLYESEETTHYSIYDKSGNAVSVTTTINSSFGSNVVVEGAGFLLNNEMDDFSSKPGVPNQFGLLGSEANSIEPGKRMLSSMTPTIVLKENEPYLVVGSPGGSTIMTVVLQVILNCIDFGMSIRDANDAPRIHHQWYPDEIWYEKFGLSNDVMENMQRKGHIFAKKTRTLGLVEGIMIDKKAGIISGATDKRGYGLAEGY